MGRKRTRSLRTQLGAAVCIYSPSSRRDRGQNPEGSRWVRRRKYTVWGITHFGRCRADSMRILDAPVGPCRQGGET